MGWNRPSEEKKVEGKGRQWNGRLKGLIAGAIVVVGAAVAAWWIFGDGPAPVREGADGTMKGLIREAKPAERPKLAEKPEQKEKPEQVEVTIHGEKKLVDVKADDGYFYMKYPSGRTVRTRNPYLIKAMQEQAARFDPSQIPEPDPNAPKPRYKTPALCVLAQYAIPGGESSPPGPMTDRECVGILEEKIEIEPDDTDQIIEEKEYLVELQAEYREHMKNGGRAEEFFQRAYERQQLEAEAINTARKEVRTLAQEGHEEDAVRALETYNKYLESRGIKPIKQTKALFRRKPKPQK